MAKLSQLNKSQQTLVEQLVSYGVTHGAKAPEILAAIETAAVENNYSNAAGKGSAVGWRQEEPSYGTVAQRLDLGRSIPAFYNEIKAVYAKQPHLAPGEAAQAVQRSAYPKRYGEHSAEAQQIASELHLKAGEGLQLSEVPVVGPPAAAAATAVGEAGQGVGELVAVLIDPQTWLRVAEGVGGIVLLAMGLRTLTRGAGGGAVGEAGRQARSAGAVVKAAKLAAHV